ncbi:SPOR domain-containing protein [Deinococcus taeanensis]|uniref:SPOR domain-containing protein n=1 Tax=Deinococcus taeanensis TaxID=2737050 RepID=UPI001CDBB374|nr:SPOR domain-containing protein [Deinococcus taeanensis]UBV41559.1 SPOR domain-containing protein [Deinococcus taeanensis]
MSGAARPRRWPDLMIGTLVVLLLGGFGALILRPAPTATPAPSPTGSAEATDIPAAPSVNTAAESTTDTAPMTAAPTGSAEAAAESPASTATAAEPTTEEAPVIAAAPIGAPDPALSDPAPSTDTSTTTQATSDPASTDPADKATDNTTPATDTAQVTPRSGGAVAASEQRVPLRSDYRISLGSFRSEDAARSGTASVSGLGYTVYPIDLGSEVVAQIGPFTDEAAARQALADVQRAYPGALLYPPRGRSLTGTSTPAAAASTSPSSPSAPAATEPAAPADTTASTPSPAADGPTYLQVGAFDRLESAQNLVQQLRDLGYAPTVNAPEGRKVTVLVGPYTGDPLSRTEARLDANGLPHFRVR